MIQKKIGHRKNLSFVPPFTWLSSSQERKKNLLKHVYVIFTWIISIQDTALSCQQNLKIEHQCISTQENDLLWIYWTKNDI